MFGHFIYAALNGHKLMGGQAKQHKQPEEDHLSEEAKDIIDRLTVHDPQERLGLNGPEEVINHPFFKGVDWDKLRRKEYDMPNKPEKNRQEQLAEIEAEGIQVDEQRAKQVWYGGG